MNKPRRPALSRSPRTAAELNDVITWAFGPRVKVVFTDIVVPQPNGLVYNTVEATYTIDGEHVGVHNGGIINGVQVGQERHTAFWGRGWVTCALTTLPPVAALATDELKAWQESRK